VVRFEGKIIFRFLLCALYEFRLFYWQILNNNAFGLRLTSDSVKLHRNTRQETWLCDKNPENKISVVSMDKLVSPLSKIWK
jgi:hypothetical protein